MNARPTFPHSSSLSITVAAALATFIAIGLLAGVVFLFEREGSPMEKSRLRRALAANAPSSIAAIATRN